MATKYIVNNVTGQTITGDLTISGNLNVTGTSSSNGIATYKALLTQTTPLIGTDISFFGFGLIIGESYTIDTYVAGDDFSNVANVTSGNINETGCHFIATGETPNVWIYNSQLTSGGNFVVDVLENSLGYNLAWYQTPYGGNGYYVAVNETTGPITNSFPRQKVQIKGQITQPYDWGFPYVNLVPQIISFASKDDAIVLNVIDYDLIDSTNNALFYTPIEINVKITDFDETPIVISGTIQPDFPFYNPSFDLSCGFNNVGTFYGLVLVSNLTELIDVFNTDTSINFLGTFSEDNGNIILTMKTNLKNQFCSDNTLTFNVFND